MPVKDQQFLHLKTIKLDFKKARPNFEIEVTIQIEDELKETLIFSQGAELVWERELYVSSLAHINIKISTCKKLFKIRKSKSYANITVNLEHLQVNGDVYNCSDEHQRMLATLTFNSPPDSKHVLDLLGENTKLALASKFVVLDSIEKISAFAKKVLDVTAKVVEVGTTVAEVNSIAMVAFEIAAIVFKSLQQQQACHRAAVELMETLASRLPLADIIPENVQSARIRESLHLMLRVMEQALRFLANYAKAPSYKDLLLSQQAMTTIASFKERLNEALMSFHVSLSAQQLIALQEANDNVKEASERARMANERAEEANKLAEEQKQADALRKLNPVAAAQFSEGNSCMDGTRTVPLEQIVIWSEGGTPSRLFWINGLAGSGKSTIAATVCERLRAEGTLAGAFFCKRDVPEQRDPRRILPSLSFLLAKTHKPYRDLVCVALEKEADILASPLTYQLSTLFTIPFSALQEEADCRIFVVDALDECGDSSTRSQIADCLCQLASLTTWLKVFVSSRPQPEISRKFSASQSVTTLDLNSVDAESDIMKYTKSCLENLVNSQNLDKKWMDDEVAMVLAKKASGLFIWMSTVTRFISGQYDQDDAMEKITSGQDTYAGSSLDSLYMTVLRSSRRGSDGANASLLKTVLGIIYITAKNRPLSIDGLHQFMPSVGGKGRLSKNTLKAIVDDLRSVLYEDSSQGGIIRVCHPSFLDFLENHERCGDYWTNADQLNQMMIEKCLNVMRTELKFNICALESSYRANGDVPDLRRRIEERVSESLQYSCLYWTTHLNDVNRTVVDQLVSEFFGSLQVLFWLEVLGLIGDLKKGLDTLQAIGDIYQDQNNLCQIARDVHRLLSSTYDTINYSTSHLYISAIAWLPEESPLRLLLSPHFINQPLLMAGRHKAWHRTRWMNAMGGIVNEVAFSSDGRLLAACSRDETINIWEAKTGLIVTKLKGHSGPVRGITFSPDRKRLAAGSEDDTIRVWDLDTGLVVGSPMIGHANTVDSLCYSPDGKFIASRSYDKTVRIWESTSGKQIRDMPGQSEQGCIVYSPDGGKIASCGGEGITVYNATSEELLGEITCDVLCVAYSPNGEYLASGGEDNVVRLWDGKSLAEVAVLGGHAYRVHSVTFSPDGSELLSASNDATLIRWNTATLNIIGSPFRAHEATIFSAVYSPDGLSIASGSEDCTVRLWEVQSIFNAESPVSQLNRAFAVACSPNNNEFASATADGNVRIHDINSGATLQTLTGHSDKLRAVAYSSDGSLLASGSDDNTIMIWNTKTRTELQTLHGHSRRVNSVVFLPDGQHVISASDDGTIRHWHVDSGDGGKILLTRLGTVESVCLSPDGKLLASGGRDKTILFSDPETGTEIGQPCTSEAAIRALAFSPTGKYVASGSEDFKIQIWDVGTRTELRSLEEHSSYVLSLAFSPDGKQLISSSGDGTVRQWDVESGSELRKLIGHTHIVWGIVYSADGKRILSASDDGTIRIWNSDATQKGYVEEIDQELSSLPLIDGWIESREKELLLWVPAEYRHGIQDVCEVCVPADAPGHPVRLNWSKLVKGDEWTSILKDTSRRA